MDVFFVFHSLSNLFFFSKVEVYGKERKRERERKKKEKRRERNKGRKVGRKEGERKLALYHKLRVTALMSLYILYTLPEISCIKW